MRRKKLKLQNLDVELRSRSIDNPLIFKGIVAHVNGYTQPSLNDLHTLIVTHGGGFLQYLDGKTMVTHVIASNLTPKKKVDFARYRIVKPAWVVDSVKAGKQLPWDAYRALDEGFSQKVLAFDNGRVMSQSTTQRMGYRDQTENSWYTSQMHKDTKEPVASATSIKSPEADPERAMPVLHDQARSLSPSELSATGECPDHVPRSSTQKDLSFLADEIEIEDDAVGKEQDTTGSKTHINGGQHSEAIVDQNTIDCDAEFRWNGERQKSTKDDELDIRSDATAQHPFLDENKIENTLKAAEARQSPEAAALSSPERRKLTPEEHNARLLSDPHLAKSSTANPEFLNQYYRESRLHHLSTWKAELKAQLQSLANELTSSQKSQQKRPSGARRYVMHVDFDSFFAAVSLRKHPHLVDKPVVIAHGSGPGSEIASCNYPARKFGVKNGMWMKSALQLCPDLKTLPYDYKAYEEASRHFYEAIIATDGIVQSVSIDEALVDISNQCIAAGGTDGKVISEGSIYREQARADEVASNVRALIMDKTGCAVSVGVGNNILLAKVALRKAKPAGQYHIKPGEELDFIGELTVQDLPGVAYSLGGKLEEIGVKYVRDIRELTKERLVGALGPKTGERLWEYSRGIDKTEVGEQAVRKSVSAEVNWGIRFVTQEQADEFVQCLCDELSRRLLEQAVKGRQLTMKIMRRAADAPMDPPKNLGHGKCDTFNKSAVLGVATNDKVVLGREALSILKGFGFSPGELRGLGVQVQKLEPLKPSGKLFSSGAESSQRRLQFKQSSSLPSMNGRMPSPTKNSKPPAPSAASAVMNKPTKFQDQRDPIERSPTPEEETDAAPIKGALAPRPGAADATYKPLNITGTQFVVPTQIDPSVLAELPPDICSKLAPKQKRTVDTPTSHPPLSPTASRPLSPSPSVQDLPHQSQLDPETLNALPEDVKNELLSFYVSEASKTKSRSQHQQQLLPQSPRKPKPVLASKKQNLTPTNKHKTSSALLRRGRPPKSLSLKPSNLSTLTQSNFLANPINNKRSVPGAKGPAVPEKDMSDPKPPEETGEISQSFLSALPPDLRAEIVSQQRRERLKQRSGLDISSSTTAAATRKQPNHSSKPADPLAGGQRRLTIPPKAEIPTFTSKKLSTVDELRGAMSAWVEEFSSGAADGSAGGVEDEREDEKEDTEGVIGPYDEDVEALSAYLGKVVSVEGNMDKAISVVDWIGWLVGELEERKQGPWVRVLDRLKEAVRDAVRARGLGEIDFG